MAGNAGLFKFLRPSLRPQSTDVTAAAMWGVAVTSGAVWLIQPCQHRIVDVDRKARKKSPVPIQLYPSLPFDWLKKQFASRPEEGSA